MENNFHRRHIKKFTWNFLFFKLWFQGLSWVWTKRGNDIQALTYYFKLHDKFVKKKSNKKQKNSKKIDANNMNVNNKNKNKKKNKLIYVWLYSSSMFSTMLRRTA